ncbi:alkylation response protein AidB-like acyl-CoA dehydrogenase [Nonomuraea thailandensis]|uniref:Alkylation response protein AidB-like acyl-CoA dehydrogenase n=1 Tax=Nonomuraea thailandensis TaxID=1188745 RepID=A0A9X2GQN4_9ACTN|nr:acyl-CoA dehydrogenase family protein [Nonomuraea thailandensis]MCP2363456.1 alkylation response protein AidB-like acyl-CoA dehydrogenase [Nonomuraea thailandensis]
MSDTPRLHRAGRTLLERARDLRTLIESEAGRAEAEGRLTTPVVDALHEAGLFGGWVPVPLGGAELSPGELLDVFEELTYADPSTGWVVMATTLENGTAGAYLGDDAVERLFKGPRMPLIAGQGTRPGVAVPENGGFRLTGQWSFASGMYHAQYAHSAAVVEGTDEVRIFISPMEDVKILGNWDVLGLRATGSVDYTIDGAFVPQSQSHDFATTEPLRGGAIFRLGLLDQALICHSGWALGIGRRLLDELARYAAARSGRPGQLAGSDAFHAGFARTEARFRAASALIRETWDDVERTLDAGGKLGVRQETMVRLALNHITSTIAEVAGFVYASGGTTSLRDGLVQRLFRDAQAGTAHILSGPQALQECGRELAGLAEGQSWVVLALEG